ncbi:Uncharacterised protein [[Clostridium] sordellii]|uniref:hypothetical protein n=1 Tax=Paraclostridium sordellii TaxID=1505 RepID=UPI0005DDD58C|nr:hypothetical protein [Paeniclostridium sordellii]CEQ01650.1 Uncharacterised protein [[Clostridium] sordellii] [Paeniclostridium sordellii]
MINEVLDYLYSLKSEIEETYIDDVEDAIVKQTEIGLVESIINHIESLRGKE